MLVAILSTYEFSNKTLSYVYPAGNNFDNFLYLILSFNFKYLYYINHLIKYHVLFYIIDLFLIFLNNKILLNIF